MKITVIIPIYNAEKFLDECIQSILNQDFADFEILLINDGSTDSSGAKCDSYLEKDSRVKVFHTKNGGVSKARNFGLDHASGEWITFVDSDDYISENYFSPILNFSNKDLILLNIKRFKNNKESEHLCFQPQELQLKEFLLTYQLYPHFPGPCGKFFLRSKIEENQITFDENMSWGEDAVFNLEYIMKCKNILISNQQSYCYRDTEDGLSKVQLNFKDTQYFYEAVSKVLKNCEKSIYSRHIVYPLNKYLLALYRSTILKTEKKKYLKQLVDNNKSAFIYLYQNSKIKYLIMISYSLGNYYFLNEFFKRKLI